MAIHLGDLGDTETVSTILKSEQIDLVMHFGAYCYVGESVTNPLKYYLNNSAATMRLLQAMLQAGVKKFIFSSTCATSSASLPAFRSTSPFPRLRSILTARPSTTWRT